MVGVTASREGMRTIRGECMVGGGDTRAEPVCSWSGVRRSETETGLRVPAPDVGRRRTGGWEGADNGDDMGA